MTRQLDEIDRGILAAMTRDARQTVRALAREVGLSEPSVRDRLQRLENDGVITGYHARLDPVSVAGATAAFINLRFEYAPDAKERINATLAAERCVLEVHQVAGDDCYLVKVRTADTAELADLVDRIRAIPSVTSTGTTIALRTILERPLGVDDPQPEGERLCCHGRPNWPDASNSTRSTARCCGATRWVTRTNGRCWCSCPAATTTRRGAGTR